MLLVAVASGPRARTGTRRAIAHATTAGLFAMLAMACSGGGNPPAASVGCAKDTDCKDSRICVSGVCTDVGSGSDATSEDWAESGIEVADEPESETEGAVYPPPPTPEPGPEPTIEASAPEASAPVVAVEAGQDAALAEPWCAAVGAVAPGGIYGATGCVWSTSTPSGIENVTYYCSGQYDVNVYNVLAPLACSRGTNITYTIQFCGDEGPPATNYLITPLDCPTPH